MIDAQYEFDVALSFAGEDREYVEQVAEFLKDAGVRVFYDRYESIELWGKDLYVHLDEVYRKKARYCVMFLSVAFRDKLWTNQERESAQARAFKEKSDYILPARFDDTEIPGIKPTTGYVDLRSLTPNAFGQMILQKIGKGGDVSEGTGQRGDAADIGFRIPTTGGRSFNPYEEALKFIDFLSTELKRRCDALSRQGVSASVFDREGHKCLRVVLDGETKFSLDVWMGGMLGDTSINFYGVPGESRGSSGSINAWGDIVWDKDQEAFVLRLHDVSLLGHLGEDSQYTYASFVDAIWNVICDALEANN